MPAVLEWKIQRKTVTGVMKEEERQNNETEMYEGQLDNAFASLSAAMFEALPQATGVTLDELLGDSSGSAHGVKRLATPIAADPESKTDAKDKAHDDEDDLLHGHKRTCGINFQRVASVAQEKPADDAGKKAANKACEKHKVEACASPADPKTGGAAGGGSGARAAGGGSGARGRPSHDEKQVAADQLKQFQQCSQDERFFSDLTNNRRTLDRVHKEFSSLINTPENRVDLTKPYFENDEENNILRKQLQAALDVCKAWVKVKRVWNAEFNGAYKAALLFLRADPVAPIPFPVWMAQMFVAQEIEVCVIASIDAIQYY
jgi:hypothetical protein